MVIPFVQKFHRFRLKIAIFCTVLAVLSLGMNIVPVLLGTSKVKEGLLTFFLSVDDIIGGFNASDDTAWHFNETGPGVGFFVMATNLLVELLLCIFLSIWCYKIHTSDDLGSLDIMLEEVDDVDDVESDDSSHDE
jgi:hypothetical protein